MKNILEISGNLIGDVLRPSQEKTITAQILACDSKSKDKHIIILHGWGNNKENMEDWAHFLRNDAQFSDRTIWNMDYPSSLNFKTVSKLLLKYFKKKEFEGYYFEDVIFVGYSMGGIIARQMVADGFQVTKLVTLCSPHEGLNWYVPPVNAGVSSLKKSSKELMELNIHPIDEMMRDRYLFCSIGFAYRIHLGRGEQDGDTMVSGKSARGESLGTKVKRFSVQVIYHNVKIEPGAPHLEGMNPEHFDEVMTFLKKEIQIEQLA